MSKIKYHPCSKEFQEEAKKLGLTGNQLIKKYVQEGKLRNPTDVDRETNTKIYQKLGFNKKSEYVQDWRYKNGIQLPMSENENCAHYLGTYIAERKYGRLILPEIFGGIEKEMPCGNPKYDFIVNGGIKIDIKSSCVRKNGWDTHIRYNNITDYFVILAFEDRKNLNLRHVWCIGKDEKIRGDNLYRRDSIRITNRTSQLLQFKRFDWIDRLECLKNNENIVVLK